MTPGQPPFRAVHLLNPSGEQAETFWMDEDTHERFQDLRGRLHLPSEEALLAYLLNQGLECALAAAEQAQGLGKSLADLLQDTAAMAAALEDGVAAG